RLRLIDHAEDPLRGAGPFPRLHLARALLGLGDRLCGEQSAAVEAARPGDGYGSRAGGTEGHRGEPPVNDRDQTLKRKLMTSPSRTSYSLPSSRSVPLSPQAPREPAAPSPSHEATPRRVDAHRRSR